MTIRDIPPMQPIKIRLVADDDGDAKALQRAFDRAKIAKPIIRALDRVDALDLLRDDDKAAAFDLNVAGYIVKEVAGDDFLRLIGLVDSYWRSVELPAV